MAIRISAVSDPETKTTHTTVSEIPAEEKSRLDRMSDGVESEPEPVSPYRKRLLAMNRPVVSPVEVCSYKGEDWYIRRLNFAQQTTFGMLTQRDANGVLTLDKSTLTSLVVASVFVAVSADVNGEADFFAEIGEAWDFVNSSDPKDTDLLSFLFDQINTVNPRLIKKAETEDLDDDVQKKSEKAAEKNPEGDSEKAESTKPPTT